MAMVDCVPHPRLGLPNIAVQRYSDRVPEYWPLCAQPGALHCSKFVRPLLIAHRLEARPATAFAPDVAASTASHPNVQDERETPLVEGGDGGNCSAGLGGARNGRCLGRGLDGGNRVEI